MVCVTPLALTIRVGLHTTLSVSDTVDFNSVQFELVITLALLGQNSMRSAVYANALRPALEPDAQANKNVLDAYAKLDASANKSVLSAPANQSVPLGLVNALLLAVATANATAANASLARGALATSPKLAAIDGASLRAGDDAHTSAASSTIEATLALQSRLGSTGKPWASERELVAELTILQSVFDWWCGHATTACNVETSLPYESANPVSYWQQPHGIVLQQRYQPPPRNTTFAEQKVPGSVAVSAEGYPNLPIWGEDPMNPSAT